MREIDWDKCIFNGDKVPQGYTIHSMEHRIAIPIKGKRIFLIQFLKLKAIEVNKKNFKSFVPLKDLGNVQNWCVDWDKVNDVVDHMKWPMEAIVRAGINGILFNNIRFDSENFTKNDINKLYNTICDHLNFPGEAIVGKEGAIYSNVNNTLEDGCMCRICHQWHPMAVPDGSSDGKMNCWNCTNYRQHKVAVAMRKLLV